MNGKPDQPEKKARPRPALQQTEGRQLPHLLLHPDLDCASPDPGPGPGPGPGHDSICHPYEVLIPRASQFNATGETNHGPDPALAGNDGQRHLGPATSTASEMCTPAPRQTLCPPVVYDARIKEPNVDQTRLSNPCLRPLHAVCRL